MTARLLSNESETPTTRRIKLALDGAPFVYRAGQAAALTVTGAATPSTPYSIASAPTETSRHGWLEFLVKVDGSSRFGAHVERLDPGTSVTVAGPIGAFTLDGVSSDAPLLFIAGGTGISPLRSMIVEALGTHRPGTLSLVYSARTPDEFAYLTEFRALAKEGRLSLTLTLTGEAVEWTHARGRTGAAHIEDLLRPSTVAVVCGPPAMVAEVPAALRSLGLSKDRIVTENW